MRNIIVLIVIFCTMSVFAHKTDSVGTRVKHGKVYVLHKVEKGDGLYSISRKYNTSLKSVVDENPGADQVIKIGQVIWIPTDRKPVLENKVVNDYFNNTGRLTSKEEQKIKKDRTKVATFAKYHEVEQGQTLYAISKLYSTSVEMIKALNSLESDQLSEGQKLLVQDGKAVTTEVDTEGDVETDYEAMKNEMDKNKYEDIGFEGEVEEQSSSTNGYTIKIEKLVEFDIKKIEETGTTGVGGPGIPSDKNFALHFNAPIGTVVLVTNPDTRSTVFIKVIGNFTKKEKGAEIIRLSAISAEKIGVKSKDSILLSYAL